MTEENEKITAKDIAEELVKAKTSVIIFDNGDGSFRTILLGDGNKIVEMLQSATFKITEVLLKKLHQYEKGEENDGDKEGSEQA